MNMDLLFSTKERIKILKYIIYKTNQLSVNRIAKELKLSNGLVSKYFDYLTKDKILKKKNRKFFVQDTLNTKSLKILLNLDSFDVSIFKKYKFVKSAGFYGSFVKGTNTEDSDIDLWIFIEKTNEKNLASLTRLLKNFGNVKPLYLTREKIQVLKKEDNVFYNSLIFGSIVIWGDGIEKI